MNGWLGTRTVGGQVVLPGREAAICFLRASKGFWERHEEALLAELTLRQSFPGFVLRAALPARAVKHPGKRMGFP